jgi:hypothetical protein
MTRQSIGESEEQDLAQIERAMRAAGVPGVSKALPLDYAQKRSTSAPFDWAGSLRQLVFASGVGFIAGAATDICAAMPWKDNEVLWIGFGSALIALAMPWPGRVGRQRGA